MNQEECRLQIVRASTRARKYVSNVLSYAESRNH